jgi:hypothetical protein
LEVFYSLQLFILAVIQRPKSTFNILLVDTNLKEITKLSKKSLNNGYRNRISRTGCRITIYITI